MKPRIPIPSRLARKPFTSRQGAEAGLGRHRMRGPDIQRPFQGVLLPAGVEAGILELCQGLAERVPDDAFFCGQTAAKLIGIPLPSRIEQLDVFDVAVPSPNFPPSGRGIRGHMYEIKEYQLRKWAGIRLTSPERTWCDLGAALTVPELVAAGDFLIHWRAPIATIESLASEVGRNHGRRGVKKLRLALARLNDRSESPQESRLRLIVESAGIEGLVSNLEIRTSGGYDYRADLAIPSRKLIIEYQSKFHETSERFRADMTRIDRLEADEWKVMQVNKEDMQDRAELIFRVNTVIRTRPHFDRVGT